MKSISIRFLLPVIVFSTFQILLFAQSPEISPETTAEKNKKSATNAGLAENMSGSGSQATIHRIAASGNLVGTLGNLGALMPDSWGMTVAYENNLGAILPPVIAPWIHGLRLEIGYACYSSTDPVSLIRLEAGPEWFLAPWPAKFGKFHLALMPGMTWVSIQSGGATIEGVSFSASALAGYEFSFDSISQNLFLSHLFVFLHARAGFVYDSASPWTGLGGDLGAGWKF